MKDKAINNRPILLRAREAAQMLGISVRAFHNYRASGKLPPSYKLGGCVLWRADHLQKWVELGMPNIDKFTKLMKKEVCR